MSTITPNGGTNPSGRFMPFGHRMWPAPHASSGNATHLRAVDHPPCDIVCALAGTLEQLQKVLETCLVSLMRCAAENQAASLCVQFRQEIADEPVVVSRITASRLPVREVMTLVRNHD